MKSDSWLLIVMRSLKGVKTLRVEKRTIKIDRAFKTGS